MSVPFMQLYVADYLGDTMHLTTEQHGAYLLLLMAMWRNRGRVDNEDVKLARIVRMTATRWSKIRSEVVALLTVDGDHLTQSRLSSEYKKAEEKSEKRKASGKLGGHAKALKSNEPPLANATRLLLHSLEPDSEPEKSNKKKQPEGAPKRASDGKPKADQIAAEFDAWYPEFPRKVGRGQALQAFRAARARATFQELLDGAKRYASSRRGEDQKFTKHPATWLNGQCWLDGKAAPTTPSLPLLAGPAVPPKPSLRDDDWFHAVERFLGFHGAPVGVWRADLGPTPDDAGCYAPLDIIANCRDRASRRPAHLKLVEAM